MQALALFAAGRVAEQKQDYQQALRCYERALRLDPDAVPALREIVPLAFNLDRQAEAVRYALILAEREPKDPVLLRRLALYLTEEGDLGRAVALYEKALPLEEKENRPATLLPMRLEMGRLYFISKKFDESAHQFGEVLKALDAPQEHALDANTTKALLNKPELTYQIFGESFLETGRLADAEAAFEKANAAKADEGLHLYNLARLDAKAKQPAQAMAKLQTYLDKRFSGQGTGPYRLLAELLVLLGQQEQLIERLEKARAADAENVPLTYFLAQRYLESGQLDKAEPLYRFLLEHNAARPPVESYQGLIEIYRRSKEPRKLLVPLSDAVGRSGNLNSLGDAGKALLADADTLKGVLAAAQKQLADEPDKLSFGGRLAAALVAMELKDFAAAGTMFDAAIKADAGKAPAVIATWGLALFAANQYAEAAKVFQRGLDEKLVGDEPSASYFYLSGALEMNGQTDEALTAARKAAELQNESPRFQSRLGWILYHAKRYDAARQAYQALVDRFDKTYDSPEVRDVMRDARLVLSNIAVFENHPLESEEWLEQVLDEFPEDVGALNDLGYLWADSNKHLERARQMIQVAIDHEPSNMAYRDSLGWVLYRLEKYPEAVVELKVAAGGDDPDGVVLDHLGDATIKTGDAAAAIKAWTRAIDAFDKHGDADKAKLTREKIERARSAESK